jgi:hypothetical protein
LRWHRLGWDVWSVASCRAVVRIVSYEFAEATKGRRTVIQVRPAQEAIMAHGSTVADGPLLDHGATWGHVLQVRTAILCGYFAYDRPP